MTALCLLAKPWRHVALLDYLPLELRQQRNGSQQEVLDGLRKLLGTSDAQRGDVGQADVPRKAGM